MHTNQSVFLHLRQSVPYRMETGLSAIGYSVGKRKTVICTKALPVGLLLYRKYHYQFYLIVVSMKSLQRAHQYRFAFYRNELLGNIASHPQALSACNALPEISLSFTVSDRDALRRQALQAAAKNAREEAEILCDAANVRLGGLLEIRHEQGGRVPLSPTRFAADDARMFAAPARAAIRPEEVEIEDGASFTWEIE